MNRFFAVIISLGLLTPVPPAESQPASRDAPDDVAVVREFVKSLPPGTDLRVVTSRGEKIRGTLMAVDDRAVTLKPRVRVPEPMRRVPITEIVDADVVRGMGAGKAAAIGVASGGGAFFGILVALIAAASD